MKGYRTLAFNLFVAVLGVVVVFDWSSVIPAKYMGAVLVAIAIANAGLRAITTTPVGKAE